MPGVLNLVIEPRRVPHFQQLGLARRQLRFHGEIGARQIERVLVIAAHQRAATVTFATCQSNEATAGARAEFDAASVALYFLALGRACSMRRYLPFLIVMAVGLITLASGTMLYRAKRPAVSGTGKAAIGLEKRGGKTGQIGRA